MTTHPLDSAIIDLCSVERGYEDTGLAFPGYLGEHLSRAFDTAYTYWLSSGDRRVLIAAGEIVSAEIALKRGEDLAMMASLERARVKLQPLADWPAEVAGPRWTDNENDAQGEKWEAMKAKG